MKKNVVVYTPGEPDQVVEAECYYQLTIVMIIGGVEITRYVRGDTAEELQPKKVSVEGVSFIRYIGENGEYVEFLQNAIVFRQLEYIEDLPTDKPSQRERDHEEIEQDTATETE